MKLERPEDIIIAEELILEDFNGGACVEIVFSDGPEMKLKNGFMVMQESSYCVGVFTADCGWHTFPVFGPTIKQASEDLYRNETYEG